MKHTHVIIMAGGIGSRFWPISVPEYPKQFIDVLGIGKSLLQLTVERFQDICPTENVWVVTSKKYVNIVRSQIPQLPEQHILAEPVGRNTAPCIAYACWKIKQKDACANLVVTPSDALIIQTNEFTRCIQTALNKTKDSSAIVTLGIHPTRPETGYGYIAACEEQDSEGIHRVKAFKEKPNLEVARKYIENGNYYWNAGIFVWNINTVTTALKQFAPQIASVMDELNPFLYTENEPDALARLFPTCEKISIDYAVMEKSSDIFVLPATFEWSDLGNWSSLHTQLPHDKNNNATVGNHIKLFDCQNCIVHTTENQQVVLEGLNGYIVAQKENKLLVCRLENEQMIKEFTD